MYIFGSYTYFYKIIVHKQEHLGCYRFLQACQIRVFSFYKRYYAQFQKFCLLSRIGVFLYIMYVVMVSNKVRLNLPKQLGCNRCPTWLPDPLILVI